MNLLPVVTTQASMFILDILEESGSSSDSDIEDHLFISLMLKRKKKKGAKPPRIENYIENVIPHFNAHQFQENFRIPINGFEHLVNVLGPILQRQGPVGRKTVSVEKQILAVTWLLATPDSYRSVGERFDLAKSTLCIVYRRVVDALVGIGTTVIKWPQGNEYNRIKAAYNNMGPIENVIGCVDGTYIPIKAPKYDAQSYVTRKCHYAITMQAIADPFLKFMDIFVDFPGSVSDSRIFRNSDIYNAIRNNPEQYLPNGEYVLGDKAYPLLEWCLVPYIDRGHLTEAQKYFNTVLSKKRQTVERSFALFFGRFRRFKYLDMICIDYIPSSVLAACVMHNICIDAKDDRLQNYINEGLVNVLDNDNVEIEPRNAIIGRKIRYELCRILFQQRRARHER